MARGEKFAGLKLFDLGKLKNVTTMTDLENMYVSSAIKVPSEQKPTGEFNKRNKYFDHKGSIFGMSNETPTLFV